MVKSDFFKMLVILIIVLPIIGCAGRISDDTIKSQVTNYLSSLHAAGFLGGDIPFSKFFDLVNVTVEDKMVKGKECIAICNITTSVKIDYDAGSAVDIRFRSIIGEGCGEIGEIKSKDVKFVFEKFEKGWKIKEHISE